MTNTETAPLPVHIYFLLDRTGSMQPIADDVIGGFNKWLEDQKAKPGECRVTLVQFDSQDAFEVIHDAVPIAEVEPLNKYTFVPRGMTPLFDAEGRLMTRARERMNEREALGEPAEAILVVTYTDGLENKSSEWTEVSVRALKKELEGREVAFAYLGVGHDAYSQASRVGTHKMSTRSYGASGQGVQNSYADYMVVSDTVRHAAGQGMRVNSSDLFDRDPEPVAQAEDSDAS